MDREVSKNLDAWLKPASRLPLVVRGARQVGKTWLIRDLAKRHNLTLVECNFEQRPRLARAFTSNRPARIFEELSYDLDLDFDPARSLIFLDEIQAAGEVLAALRWFAEDRPEVPVVAAGSLLEFTLGDHAFSMPVGRIGYLHLEPMSFPEYVRAHGQQRLWGRLLSWRPGEPVSPSLHERLTSLHDRYLMVGGMPRAVLADIEGYAAEDVRRVQTDLVTTFRDDFGKYAARTDPRLLDDVLFSVARQLGGKFVFSRVSENVRVARTQLALELLTKARLVHRVSMSTANGIPLAGQVNERYTKAIVNDVGILQALLGTPSRPAFPSIARLSPQIRGKLFEQAAGQALRTQRRSFEEPRLFYWQRTGGRTGEIDYVVQVGDRIVPIEVKAGKAGAMKSLHQFMYDKQCHLAVRLDANPPTVQNLDLSTTRGDRVRYRLLSLPHYLAWWMVALVEILIAEE